MIPSDYFRVTFIVVVYLKISVQKSTRYLSINASNFIMEKFLKQASVTLSLLMR